MSIDIGRKDELSRKQEAFWKAALSGAPELLTIQTDYPRPAVLGAEDQRAEDQQVEGALQERQAIGILGRHPTRVCAASGRMST